MTKRLILLTLLAAVTAFPQILSLGVKGGVPFTDAFNTAKTGRLEYISDTKRYTVGPTVELHLPFRLGIEFDALYKRLDFESTSTSVDVFTRTATTANSWEFPLLLKWRVFGGPIRPYVEAGPTFDKLSDISQLARTIVFPNRETSASTGHPPELQNTFRVGATVGAGIELGSRRFRISPEVRYTRWGWENFQDLSGGSLLRSNDNQAEFLLGITF